VNPEKNRSSAATYTQGFEAFNRAFGQAPAWANQLRQEAATRFAALGFPTRQNEAWKYTPTSGIQQQDFQMAPVADTGLRIEQLRPFLFGREDWPRLVLVNGLFSAKLSQLGKFQQAIQVVDLSRPQNLSQVLTEQVGRYAKTEKAFFTALNTAFLRELMVITPGREQALEEPLHLMHVTVDAGTAIVAYPRLLVLAEPNSRTTLVESYISLSGEPHFNNAVTEIVLENGAALDHVKLLKEGPATFHMAAAEVYQNQNSQYRNWSLALSGQWTRQDLHVALDAEGAACACDGLYLLTEGRHVDHHLLVDHWKPQGTSSQLYKGILEGKSTGVFNGKTFVHAGAQKTAATQTNKNLLLSDNATMDTKPELEIYADDVKCSHGATVGQIDPEAIFYFKSRGIGEARARQLICYGFAKEVIEKIPLEAVRAELDAMLMAKLGV